MLVSVFFLLLGLAILIVGAESMVKGSSSLAKIFGFSPLVIGLTIVAFGTSAPELIVSLYSAHKGEADLAIGNIIGSNISNILLILGLSTTIRCIRVRNNTVWKEIPFALLAIVMVYILGNDAFFDGSSKNMFSRTDGFALLCIFAVFMVYVISIAKNNVEQSEIKEYSLFISVILTLAGLVSLFYGGEMFVDNAVKIARLFGLSEILIGATIVAIGTSLPELATTVVASYRRCDDIAIGNVVGSNIFNVFWILGLSSALFQVPFNSEMNSDIAVAFSCTLLLFIGIFVGKKHHIDRWQGPIYLLLYLLYIAFLIKRG